VAKRKQLINVGDTVTIEVPQLFESIGYDYSIVEAMSEVHQNKEMVNLSIKATNFIKNSGAPAGAVDTTFLWNPMDYRLQNDILQAMAYQQLDKRKQKGVERKLFEELPEYHLDMKHHIWKVIVVSKIMTGKYQPSNLTHDNFYDGDSYEPAALTGRKFHRVLHLSLYVKAQTDPEIYIPKHCKIRDIFCSKVNGGNNGN